MGARSAPSVRQDPRSARELALRDVTFPERLRGSRLSRLSREHWVAADGKARPDRAARRRRKHPLARKVARPQALDPVEDAARSDLLDQPQGLRHRADAELFLQLSAPAVMLAQGPTALPIEQQQDHQIAVNRLAEWVGRENAARDRNRFLVTLEVAVLAQQLGRGPDEQGMQPLALFQNPVGVLALQERARIDVDGSFQLRDE